MLACCHEILTEFPFSFNSRLAAGDATTTLVVDDGWWDGSRRSRHRRWKGSCEEGV